ncbi:7440_t:CDS:2, partial [Racocetra persica]
SQVHFKGFSGKPAIEKERDRLLDLIDNQHQDRLAEVQAAITEIKQVLQNAEANFENSFRYKSSSDIQAEKAKITTKINDYLNQESSNSKTIIAEIENMLRTSGKLQAKSKNEREAEKNRLIKLIEDEIKRKKDA